MSQLAIQTIDLQRDFREIHAVDKINLNIPSGTVFGFLGPNGAGKTTTIRLLLGLLEPSGGQASVLGYDVRTQSGVIRENCGALLENHGLYERLTAEDNLDFYGRIWRINRVDRQTRIFDLLNKLGLWERRKEVVNEWSRGMKQKLAVARTLFHRPRLVFLDEPTAGLDPIAAASLREDLALLAETEGVTVFLTTHNMAEAEKLCHYIGVIRQGKLIACGTPLELKSLRGTPRIIVHGSGFSENLITELSSRAEILSASLRNGALQIDFAGGKTADLISMLVARGVQIEEVRRDSATLEDVFLKLMEEER